MSNKLYIVGHPVAHSKSPVMYNAVYKEFGIDWEYGFADFETSELALDFMKSGKFVSVNVTTPYKPEAFQSAEIKAATAQLAGGVNLLVSKDGHLLGYNVDGQGAVRFLERAGVMFRGAKVVVCGTGPTALSILHACVIAGASDVLLLSRDKERSRKVLEEYVEKFRMLASTAIAVSGGYDGHLDFSEAYENANFKFGSYSTSTKAISAADLIVDATVLGMKPGDPPPFDATLLHESQVVMDTVYGHGETALIKAARTAGCTAFDGAGMLVSQAVISAQTVFDIEGIEVDAGYDVLFDIMAHAAEFDL